GSRRGRGDSGHGRRRSLRLGDGSRGQPDRALAAELTVHATLFTDPGCPWAYSARPALARLNWRFGDQLEWRLVMIGLSETTERYDAVGHKPRVPAAGVAHLA